MLLFKLIMSKFHGKINGEFPSADELQVIIVGEVQQNGKIVYVKPSKEPFKIVSAQEFEEMKKKRKSDVGLEKK